MSANGRRDLIRRLKINTFTYFSSVHISGIRVPIIRRKLLYPCDNGSCHSVCVASGLLTDQTPPIKSDKYQCRINTQFTPDDGHMVARNM